MGRNRAIRQHEFHPDGQPMDLFADTHGRLPVVLELLKSPWIKRGSEIPACDDPAAARRFEKPIEVHWDGVRRAPSAFALHGRRYRVDALLQAWTLEQRWWKPEERVSRRCFRVLARGGVYDLAYDRLSERWLLVGIVD